MIDLTLLITQLIAQAPYIVITILAILLYINKRLNELSTNINNRITSLSKRINRRFKGLENRINELSNRINELDNKISMLVNFNEQLLEIFRSRDQLSETEVNALKTYLRSITPISRSKYYTEEVRKRLLELLDKDIKDYTWRDVYELEKIADLIFKEGVLSNRKELIRYASLLRVFIAMIRGELLYIRKVMPTEEDIKYLYQD